MLWQRCFILTVIILILQWFPYTGVFLMLLAAPFWSVVLINLGFVLMALEGWTKGPRWLVLFPFLWFGGYAAAAAGSHWQAHRFNAEIEGFNLGKLVAFNRAKDDVLVIPNSSDSTSFDADTLVLRFGLDRAYQFADGKFQEFMLRRSSCPSESGVGTRNGAIWRALTDGGYPTGKPMVFAKGLCHYTSFSAPSRPAISVRIGPLVQRSTLASFSSQEVTLEVPGGQTTILRSGSATTLSWFPQPIIGCGLNSGAPSWDCAATFARDSLYHPTVDLTPNGPDDVVARALRLTAVTLRERYPDVAWR